MPKNHITLNGQTLEGGGQIVRNAIALSALTHRPVTIHSIRAARPGKKGLKASHLAAVRSLAEISNSIVQGAEIRSITLSFYPPAPAEIPPVKQKYSIKLGSPGSVFLIFQALYPYLLCAGALAGVEGAIGVEITGGTNVTSSPSFDYIEQVLVPNLRKLGFPGLKIELLQRGWMTGPANLGTVRCLIDPLPSVIKLDGSIDCRFPSINLNRYSRDQIARIDITVLAPDDEVSWPTRRPMEKDRLTVREFIEQETMAELHNNLKGLPSHVIDMEDPHKPVPIEVHTSERTHHPTHIFLLIVGHTATGFRIGRDYLLTKAPGKRDTDQRRHLLIQDLIKDCVQQFGTELDHQASDTIEGTHQPCVDEYMRDQLVIFEALGRLYPLGDSEDKEGKEESIEDDRYWSLHTKTARWVCREFGLKL